MPRSSDYGAPEEEAPPEAAAPPEATAPPSPTETTPPPPPPPPQGEAQEGSVVLRARPYNIFAHGVEGVPDITDAGTYVPADKADEIRAKAAEARVELLEG